ncbi:MAG: histidine phosphotransferase family protein [Pseudomonadota bacterium]
MLGSRICHDLISPLGAIANGVELLEMSGAMSSPEMTLIAESVSHANARVRYFRIAFGAAESGQAVGFSEVQSVLSDMTRGARLKFQWRAVGEQPRQAVKLSFLLLMCFESAYPFGGTIDVTEAGGSWRITGIAEKAKIDAEHWTLLEAADPDLSAISAARVHFALASLAARDMDRAIRTTLSNSRIIVEF